MYLQYTISLPTSLAALAVQDYPARIPDPPLNGMVVPYKSPPRIWPSSRDSLIMCISTIALRQVQ